MLKKISTFKRTVKFSRPGAEVDSKVDDSFVAEFRPLPPERLEEMRAAPGGVKDHDVMREVLVGAGEDSVADVLADPIATSAGAVEYFNAISEGIGAKNSKK